MTHSKVLATKLLNLKEQLEQKKLAQAEAKGRLDELYRQLANYDCDSKEEAEEYAKELSQEVEELKTQIEKAIEEVRKELGGTRSLY